MPYIKQDDRLPYKRTLDLLGDKCKTPGELNYIISMVANKFLGDNPKYVDYNTVIGVLECAKLELYRRQVSSYEDKKIKSNGDI